MKVGLFDIETTDLSANYGVVLCAVVKEYGREEVVTIRGDDHRNWKVKRSDDRYVVLRLHDELQKYDVLVAHNGGGFDLPFLNTRLVVHGVSPLPQKMLIDPCRLARWKLRLNSNRLDQLISTFGFDNLKTPVDSGVWLRASLDGDRAAMDFIVDHCVRDVRMLEQVYDKIRPFVVKIDHRGSSA